jgi:hypothetical protein
MFYNRGFLVVLMSVVFYLLGCTNGQKAGSASNVLSTVSQQSGGQISGYFNWKNAVLRQINSRFGFDTSERKIDIEFVSLIENEDVLKTVDSRLVLAMVLRSYRKEIELFISTLKADLMNSGEDLLDNNDEADIESVAKNNNHESFQPSVAPSHLTFTSGETRTNKIDHKSSGVKSKLLQTDYEAPHNAIGPWLKFLVDSMNLENDGFYYDILALNINADGFMELGSSFDGLPYFVRSKIQLSR